MHGVLCELCRKRPATLHLLEHGADGACAELNLCKTCHAERGLDLAQEPQPIAQIAKSTVVSALDDEPPTPASGNPVLDEDAGTGAVVGVTININLKPGKAGTAALGKKRRPALGPDRRCPECGLTLVRFAKSNRFGCAACYGAFAEHLDRVFAEIHHGNRHIGRHPAGNVVDAQARIAERLRLRKRLDQALASEDYRLAAELRDALKTAEVGEGREMSTTKDTKDTKQE